MNPQTFIHYISSLSQTLLRFAGYGAGFAAGAGIMIISISTRIGENAPVNNERFLEVVINYAILGAGFGLAVGLVYWIWKQMKT